MPEPTPPRAGAATAAGATPLAETQVLPLIQEPLPGPVRILFLDVDGTLLELAPEPGAVVVEPELLPLLARLRAAADGALALVSGRTIADLDRLFGSLALPTAGLHGGERRDAHGRLHVEDVVHEQFGGVRAALRELAAHPKVVALGKPVWITTACPATKPAARRRMMKRIGEVRRGFSSSSWRWRRHAA